MYRHLLLAVAAAVAVLAHGPAAAAASSSASYSNFGFRLIDLNPLDNVGPSITFADGSLSYSSAQVGDFRYQYTFDSLGILQTYNGAIFNASDSTQYGASPFGASSAQVNNIDSTASASNTSSSAIAAGSTNGTRGINSDYANYSAGNSAGGGFTISANTIVIFSAEANIGGSVTTGYRSSVGDYNDNYEYSYSSIGMVVGGNAGDNSQNTSDGLSGQIYNTSNSDQNGNYLPGSYSSNKLLSASFSNLSNVDQVGSISIYGQAGGTSWASAAAVPEPETYVMMLAGLCGLAGVGRRRQPRAGAGEVVAAVK
jgi:hypothetical protein